MANKVYSFLKARYINLIKWTYQIRRILTGTPLSYRSQLTPELFVGGQYSKRGLRRLREWGVTAIVSMRESKPKLYTKVDWLKMLHLPTPDRTAPKYRDIQKGVKFIQKEIDSGGKVYVHCRWGEGRGPTMALAYLISTGLTLEDALTLVKKVRVFINPTKEQLEFLREYEELQD